MLIRFSINVYHTYSAIINIPATGAVGADDQSCAAILLVNHRGLGYRHIPRRVAMKIYKVATIIGSMMTKANLLILLHLCSYLAHPKRDRSRRHWLKSSDTTGTANSTPWPSCER